MIAITETWLTENIFDSEILPNQYIIYRNDRQSRGGGVLLAVQTHISSKLLSSPTNLEMLTVELNLSKRIIICVVYFPPNPTVSQIRSLSDHLSEFQQPYNVILLGDFNLPDINWETMCGNCQASDDFCDMTFELNLIQFITCPTHIHGNILDPMMKILSQMFQIMLQIVLRFHQTISLFPSTLTKTVCHFTVLLHNLPLITQKLTLQA